MEHAAFFEEAVQLVAGFEAEHAAELGLRQALGLVLGDTERLQRTACDGAGFAEMLGHVIGNGQDKVHAAVTLSEGVAKTQAVVCGNEERFLLRTCLISLFAPRSHFYSQEITSIRLAGRVGAEMWTEAHRARHEAGLKQMVSTCAVGEMARWLEQADPTRSEKATPVLPVVSTIAWHLRVGGPWRALPGGFPAWRTVYGWFRRWLELGFFDRLLRDVARLRRRAAGRRSEPSLGIIDTQSVKCIAVRGPRGYDAAKKVLGRKRVALVDADGTWLAIAVVPASTQERDTLPALDDGKAEWPSLREAILDGGFVAERCREWSNRHGMCHRVIERDPEQKGFVVLEHRWVVERSFGWLAHWGGLLRDRAGRLDVSAARIAFAATLSAVEALLNPMPVHDIAS